MIKNIDSWRPNKMTKSKFSTISIPGATIKDVLHYINPVQDGAFSAHG